MKHKKIYLVRHGQSYGNVDPSTSGNNPELTPKGREQALTRGQELKDVPFVASYSSYLIRAQQTAELITQGRNIPHTIVPDIHERDYGDFFVHPDVDRLSLEIYEALHASSTDDWWDYVHTEAPMIESNRASFERFYKGLTTISQQHNEGNILVISHGNLMINFLVHMGQGSFRELEHDEGVVNTGYFILDASEGAFTIEQMVGVNKKLLHK